MRRAEVAGSRSGPKQPKAGVPHEQTPKRTRTGLLRNLWPMVATLGCPNQSLLIWHAATNHNGSFGNALGELMKKGALTGLRDLWASVLKLDPAVPLILGGYTVWSLLTMTIVPGRRFSGPITKTGHEPRYKDNGFSCYIITMLGLVLSTLVLKKMGMSPTYVYDNFGQFIVALNAVSIIFCLLLYLKGRVFPSTGDVTLEGQFFKDFYDGIELYPRILGLDVKSFTNCRWGMTLWGVLVYIYALKSYELYGFVDSMMVSTVLQLVYITKFFWWESGYMKSIDIITDNAGFSICWGCMVYVPTFYASVSLYLVKHPVHLGTIYSLLLLGFGLVSVSMNYMADWQRQMVRLTDGNCRIWGRKPEVMKVKYQLASGETKETILLVSGLWGVARHFNYFPELALALSWSLPALFENSMPYYYFFFLCALLIHRTYRDDQKCSDKYKEYWKEYCKRVPYRMIPGLF